MCLVTSQGFPESVAAVRYGGPDGINHCTLSNYDTFPVMLNSDPMFALHSVGSDTVFRSCDFEMLTLIM